MIDKDGVVGAVFLDLQKAFETVSHNVLIAKLFRFNYSRNALKFMKSYMADRTQCVSICIPPTAFIKSPASVSHGSVLGPLLFSLYIDDIPSLCSDINVQMYAEDIVVYIHGKNKNETAVTICCDGTSYHRMFNRAFILTLQKQSACSSKKRPTSKLDPDITVSGKEIQIVSKFKYLCITVDSNLSYTSHVKTVGGMLDLIWPISNSQETV